MTAYDGQPITYDAAGYPSSYLGLSLTWTGGRLMSVAEGTNTYTYACDGDGLRTERHVGYETYRYLYSGDTLVRIERESQGLYEYMDLLYDGRSLIGFRHCFPALNRDAVYYYVFGHGGNVEGIIDENGTLLVRYVYDAWGNFTETYVGIDPDNLDDPAVYSALTLSPLRYRSYVYDTETGLYYLQSRYYDPEVRRFISPDDVEYLEPEGFGGLNLYTYCNNDPVNKHDPTGHIAISLIVGLVVSFAIGTIASAISQYAQYGEVNLLQAGVDGLFAVVSTALAYTGIGLIGSIAAGAGMGLAQYTLDSAVFHDDFSWSGALIATGLGALGGWASGRGAQHFKSIGNNLDETGRTGVKAILTAHSRYGTGAGYQKVMNLWGSRVANSLAKSISQNFTKSAFIIWGTTVATYKASYWLGKIN